MNEEPVETTENDVPEEINFAALREGKGLSLDAISRQTNIPLKKLEALERGDFSPLGEETFVLGYIRSYAAILDVDPSVLVAKYHAQRRLKLNDKVKASARELHKETHRQTYDSYEYRLPGRKKSVFTAATMGQVSLVAGLAWLFWFFIFDSNEGMELEDSKPRSSESEQSADSAPVSVQPLIPLGSPNIGSTGLPQIQAEAPMPLMDSMPNADDSVALPNAAEQSFEQQAQTLESERVRSVTEYENALGSESSSESDTIANAELEFTFIEDCWVKVTDARGSDLIAQLRRKGDNLRLFGQPPFDILLGDARAATLLLNGEPVPINPLPGAKTLRFRVGVPD